MINGVARVINKGNILEGQFKDNQRDGWVRGIGPGQYAVSWFKDGHRQGYSIKLN